MPKPSTSEEQENLLPADAKEAPKGAGDTKPAGAEKKGGDETDPNAPPKERTYGEEEWNKRQSAIDKQLDEIQKATAAQLTVAQRRADEAETATTQTKLDAEEKAIQNMLKKVEAAGGDMEAANKLAAWNRTLLKEQADHTKKQRKFDSDQATAAMDRKLSDAESLSQKYKIDKEPLLEAKSPEEMRVLALQAYVKALESGKKAPDGKKTPTSTDKGPSGDRAGDLTGKSPTELARMAYSNPPKKKS